MILAILKQAIMSTTLTMFAPKHALILLIPTISQEFARTVLPIANSVPTMNPALYVSKITID